MMFATLIKILDQGAKFLFILEILDIYESFDNVDIISSADLSNLYDPKSWLSPLGYLSIWFDDVSDYGNPKPILI